MEVWDRALQKVLYDLSKHLIYRSVSPIARIHRSRIQEVGKGIVPHIITPSDALGNCLLPVAVMLASVGLEFWFQRGNVPSIELEAQYSPFSVWDSNAHQSTG